LSGVAIYRESILTVLIENIKWDKSGRVNTVKGMEEKWSWGWDDAEGSIWDIQLADANLIQKNITLGWTVWRGMTTRCWGVLDTSGGRFKIHMVGILTSYVNLPRPVSHLIYVGDISTFRAPIRIMISHVFPGWPTSPDRSNFYDE